MTGEPPPIRWFGFCPFCGDDGMQERDTERVCNNCGFRFKIADWKNPPE